jgi:Tol biopolymer transport system component
VAWLGAGAAAALVSFGAGYATVTRMLPLHGQPRVGAATPRHAAAPLSQPSGTSRTLESSTSDSASVTPSSQASVPKPPPAVIRAIEPTDAEPASPPSFVSNGTPLFDGSFGVMTIADGGAHSDHVQPSPDGSRIAFDSDRDGERAVYVANRDGTGVMRVSGDGDAAVPTWSPDGRQLAFARAEADRPHVWNLWLTTLADGSARRLTGFRSGQTWSGSWFPDGRQIAYTHDDRLAILDLESGAVRDYLSPVRKREVRTAAVSPDGEHVIFQVAGNGAWLLDLEDGSMRCVLTDPSAEQFAWSRDGRRVAYHSRRDGQWAMWLMGPR